MAARAFLQLRLLGAPLCCGAQAAHGGSLQARGLPHSQHAGSWAPERRLGSGGIGACCSTACAIFLDQESNLCFLHWQVDSLPLRLQGSPLMSCMRFKGESFLQSRFQVQSPAGKIILEVYV